MKKILKIIMGVIASLIILFTGSTYVLYMLKIHKENEYYDKVYSAIDFNSRVYVDQTQNLSDSELYIYHEMVNLAREISSGRRYDAVLNLNLTDILGKTEFTPKELGVDSKDETEILQYCEELLNFDLERFKYQVGYEYPFEFFWFNKAMDHVTKHNAVHFDGHSIYLPEKITLYLPVCQDYQGSDYYYVNPDAVEAAQKARDYALEIVENAKALPDYEKLLFYRNFICSETNYFRDTEGKYASEETYGAPSQMLNVFDRNPDTDVLCEGYTKAFQFLCDNTDFEKNVWCFTVRGRKNDSTQSHCWNIVHMEDGQFYLTDITVSDVLSTEDHMYGFLKGAKRGNIYNGYKTDGMKYKYLSNNRRLWLPKMLTLASHDYTVT